jgi:hypothetical protein
MGQWGRDLDRENLLWREFCRPIEIENGSGGFGNPTHGRVDSRLLTNDNKSVARRVLLICCEAVE